MWALFEDSATLKFMASWVDVGVLRDAWDKHRDAGATCRLAMSKGCVGPACQAVNRW